MNLQFRTFAITDVHTWRSDLWARGWVVRRMSARRGALGWEILLWRRDVPEISRLKLLRNRLYCAVAWPVLLIFDVGIAWSGVKQWSEARDYSNSALRKIWNHKC